MKKSLQKLVFAVGVFLFCLFMVSELKASAAEVHNFTINGWSNDPIYSCTYTIDGSIHTVDIPGKITRSFDFSGCTKYMIFCYDSNLYILAADDSLTFGIYDSSYYNLYSYKWSSDSLVYYYRIAPCTDSIFFDETSYNHCSEPLSYSSNPNDNSFEYYYEILNNSYWIRATEDFYYFDQLVFQHPLPTPTPSLQQQFQTAVEMTNLEAVMTQVVGLTPLLIGLLTTLFGFSKGLRLLFQTLRQV